MPSADEIRATIERYIEVFSAGDKDGYVGLFADDGSIEDPVGTEVRVGSAAISEFWDLVRSMSASITLRRTGPIRVAGNEAAFPMQAVTDVGGTAMVVDIIDTMVFGDDGRIAQMRAFWDPAEMRPDA
ncbi:MAG: nuclear transport factor 2 family protein [Acidimicrobiales bacterium]|jgi:steroid delta-isomerase|nr:nuclear transport factor 2 family protein [Acidimicrobiales bacterium]